MITEQYNKETVCEDLSEEFKFQSNVFKRDSRQLKKCWENIKSCAKKQLGKEKRESKLTGGGPSSFKQDDEAAAVSSIIPGQIDNLNNPFEDDNCEIGAAMLFAKYYLGDL